MLSDGETYSKSVHVNDLSFAWTGPPPCCMDRLAPLFAYAWIGLSPTVPTVFPPGGFAIPYIVYCTISTPALVFLEETLLHTLLKAN